MDLKLDDLQAFLKTHEEGTFTKAAKELGITQPALSLKIARVEEILQTAVFIREPRALQLTESGEKLLVYAKQAIEMQRDFLYGFDQYQGEPNGLIRIAAFSSIMRSIIIPKLAPLISKYRKVRIDFSSHEVFELEGVLKSNKADFIVTDYLPQAPSWETKNMGEEEYVIIEPKKRDAPHVFLDHGPFDNATSSYFEFMGMKKDYGRAYMGDVYSILDGVALGLGKAVMSKHIVDGDKRFKIIKGRKKYARPLVLSHLRQGYYSPLHDLVKKALLA